MPTSIKLGDTIGILAPASGDENLFIDEKICILKNLGFKIKTGNHLYDKLGYLAGTDEARASDLMDFFCDDNIKMIMCLRGGYGSMRILPYLDFKKLKNINKIFMGYSDITCILNTLYSKLGLVTFHGPMATSDFNDKYTLSSFINTATNLTSSYNIVNPPHIPLICHGTTNATGTLIGGNLSIICSTLGTPYEIDTHNKILFIEDVGEDVYSIDRMLCQLKFSGKLDSCSGFLLGQFKNCNTKKTSYTLNDVFNNYIFSLNKPVISNFMSGHDTPNLTIPIGAKTKLDIKKSRLCVELMEL